MNWPQSMLVKQRKRKLHKQSKLGKLVILYYFNYLYSTRQQVCECATWAEHNAAHILDKCYLKHMPSVLGITAYRWTIEMPPSICEICNLCGTFCKNKFTAVESRLHLVPPVIYFLFTGPNQLPLWATNLLSNQRTNWLVFKHYATKVKLSPFKVQMLNVPRISVCCGLKKLGFGKNDPKMMVLAIK